ncbi:MAG: chromosomal replication initiator protein DnaA [Treponema sp.]|jgi:chromosomal replication initiator protein|nr:chromosomal replication initiator protein DnaA [Treponema sp.]
MAEVDYKEFWNETLNQLRSELGEEEFSGWFTDINFLRSGENTITVGFPSGFHRDRVKTRYQNSIKTKLKALAGKDISLEFELIPGEKAAARQKSEAKDAHNRSGDVSGSLSTNTSAKNAESAKEKPKRKQHSQMRDDYTFERYIVGENNNFAHNAAFAISRNPGTAYNPFLIYGGVGLGKTHLMQAIGNYIHENSDHKVIYVTSEDFINEFMLAIRERETAAFKNKFRYTDVLLIDDIQFFQEKEQTQEELFHTFNALLNAKKQLVFTCDRPPSELKKFSERLISRFEMSLKVDLQPPRYEVRCAILKSTAENRGTIIPDEVIDLISKNISSNVRDLISALKTLIAYIELTGQPITLEIAHKKLRDVLASTPNLSIETIQKAVADAYSLSVNDLKGKKRTQKIVYPRQLAMYICREMTDFSTTEIGEAFGGKDHTTVMHSIEKIQGLFITDPSLDSTIESLKRTIKELSLK